MKTSKLEQGSGKAWRQIRVAVDEFYCVVEMDDRLRICEESLGSLGGSLKIGDAFGTHVGKVQMASQHLDKVIPGAIDRLCGIGNPEMELAAAFAQHPVIGHALNQGVMERDRSRGVVLAPVQETGFDQPAKAGLELRPVGRHRL